MMRSGNRDMRRMLDRMGLDMKDLGSVEEVIIRTDMKEIFLKKPQVVETQSEQNSTGVTPSAEQPESTKPELI